MSKSDVEKTLNKPKRVTFNEYGTKWYTYYDGDYNNFIMVSYIKDKVTALSTCFLYTSPSPRDYAASRMPYYA
ncbi:CAP-associated domain-containing protein [Staphylococcus aureus]|uniref:CAP-associated domain-containing protein n=1 Tax=Staphylococcus aureus TaxID=1280 RepID=UPI001EEFB472